VDIHPLALNMVKDRAEKKGLNNVKTIQADGKTGLPDSSIDIAFLFDIYHGLSEPGVILGEIHRVLKPSGILSVNDHHLEDQQIISGITSNGSFKLVKKGNRAFNFSKR
jgi:ubiquinone/menaquinone biosynthesis C-methylase UbiE